MISLVYPRDDETYVLGTKQALFGPFSATKVFVGEQVKFDSALESMVESRGIYRENDVTHDSISGDCWFYPIAIDAIKAPTAQYPCRIKWPRKTGPTTFEWLYTNIGLAFDGCTSRYYTTSVCNIIAQRAYFRDPVTSMWRFYEVWAWVNNPTVVTNLYLYEQTAWPSAQNYNTCGWKLYVKDTGVTGLPVNFDLTGELLFGQIEAIWKIHPGGTVTSDSSGLGYIYQHFRLDSTFSPSRVRDKIEMLTATLFPSEFPIEEKHYGELAMEASDKVNANKVNMIAFLKDLRHPTDLIPKLTNLRSLSRSKLVKRIADNYLTAKYGILPTISDIKSIVEAMRNVGPYVDRNGFDTYSAGFIDSVVSGNITYTLEQHLKLAIDEEDNEFEALIARLESMGTLPTLENVWDLVPYSFLVDWLIDVGGFLERVDSRLRITRLGVRYATMSRKQTAVGISNSFTTETPFVGTINRVHYHRWVSDQCPVPPLLLESPITEFNHWLEAGALFTQRTIR